MGYSKKKSNSNRCWMDEDKLENSENSLKSARSKPKTMAISNN